MKRKRGKNSSKKKGNSSRLSKRQKVTSDSNSSKFNLESENDRIQLLNHLCNKMGKKKLTHKRLEKAIREFFSTIGTPTIRAIINRLNAEKYLIDKGSKHRHQYCLSQKTWSLIRDNISSHETKLLEEELGGILLYLYKEYYENGEKAWLSTNTLTAAISRYPYRKSPIAVIKTELSNINYIKKLKQKKGMAIENYLTPEALELIKAKSRSKNNVITESPTNSDILEQEEDEDSFSDVDIVTISEDEYHFSNVGIVTGSNENKVVSKKDFLEDDLDEDKFNKDKAESTKASLESEEDETDTFHDFENLDSSHKKINSEKLLVEQINFFKKTFKNHAQSSQNTRDQNSSEKVSSQGHIGSSEEITFWQKSSNSFKRSLPPSGLFDLERKNQKLKINGDKEVLEEEIDAEAPELSIF